MSGASTAAKVVAFSSFGPVLADNSGEVLIGPTREIVVAAKLEGKVSCTIAPDFHACPTCHGALQPIKVQVPDHGRKLTLWLAWCHDCLEVKGTFLVLTREEDVSEPAS